MVKTSRLQSMISNRARRPGGQVVKGVRTGCRAGRIYFEVFVCADQIGGDRGVRHRFFHFERPLFFCPLNLTEVVDAGILLRGGTGFHKVGNRDRREQADDGHYDHDFHQREAGFMGGSYLHTFVLVFHSRCERDTCLIIYIITIGVHLLTYVNRIVH